jgi:CTP synthase (UTP-ammonia lyase)
MNRIAILGDFNTGYATHHALNRSIVQCAEYLNMPIQGDWIGTEGFNAPAVFGGAYSGLWIASGSPYKDMENVLDSIRYARTNGIPTLGNCGGFQHMIIEFARNVSGIENAGHEEIDPGGDQLVITQLSCSLVEKEEELTITDTDSRLFRIIGKTHFTGSYFCSYGVNEAYRGKLSADGCSFTAFAKDGHIRAFELKSHPFFLGTLFQPALLSTKTAPNPVILAFLQKAMTGAVQTY